MNILILVLTLNFASFLFAAEESFESFYYTKTGEMIMNPETFTPGIQALLKEENKFIFSKLLNNYDYLFEIGCGDSFRASDVVKFGVQFYGIDVNQNQISQSLDFFKQAKLEDKAQVQMFSALKLDETSFPIAKQKKTLIFFPFNLLGNLDDFHLVLANMVNIGQDFCFSTYKNNDYAVKSRSGYYTNCGCQQIRYSTTPIGDLFDSKDGLHSASFKISYIMELLNCILESKNKKGTIEVQDLAGIGSIIYVHDIKGL